MGDMLDHSQVMLGEPPIGVANYLRRMPHNVDAEKAVLGAILVDNSALDAVGFLTAEHFYFGDHAHIFAACRSLIAGGMTADPITLRGRIDDDAFPDAAKYIWDLTGHAVSPAAVVSYGRLLDEQLGRRALIDLGEAIVNGAYAENGPKPDAIVASAAASMASIGHGASNAKQFESMSADDMPLPSPRHWLIGNIACKQYVTVIAAPGGVGKTSLALAWALSLASGRKLVGDHVHRQCRVLMVTAEDGRDEFARRLHAARILHDVGNLGGRLEIVCLTGDGVKLVEPNDAGAFVETGHVARLAANISRHKADVVIMDPFIKLSGAPENDNTAADQAMSLLSRFAVQLDVAIIMLHHVSKGIMVAGDMNKARGASAVVDAARIGMTLTPMSTDEASVFGLPEAERRAYVRLDDGKLNLTPSSSKASWYRLQGVSIGNGDDAYPNGDNVQAIERWRPPEVWDGMPTQVINRILDDIDTGTNGELYSDNSMAGDRSAWLVVQQHAPDKTEAQCREIIQTWRKTGLLKVVDYESKRQRKTRKGFAVDDDKRPS